MDKESNKSFKYKENQTFGNPRFYIRPKNEDLEFLNAGAQPNITIEQRHKIGGQIITVVNNADLIKDVFTKSHDRIIDTLETAFDIKSDNSVLTQLSERLGLAQNVNTEIDFINYGDTQLVYTANITSPGFENKFAVLINQPHTPIGVVRREFDNLTNLHNIDPNFVIEPYAYYLDKDHELYISSYIEKARCVYGGNKEWGMFDPKPFYHFVPFEPEIANKFASSMIALLVRYYDEKQNRGVAKTQISGNDFILTQDWDKDNPYNIIENMRLISARDTIEATFDEYLNIIRKEFLIGTHYKDDDVKNGMIKINHKSEIAMTGQVIEEGIKLGLELRT